MRTARVGDNRRPLGHTHHLSGNACVSTAPTPQLRQEKLEVSQTQWIVESSMLRKPFLKTRVSRNDL